MTSAGGLLNEAPIHVPSVLIVLTLVVLMLASLALMRGTRPLGRAAAPPRTKRGRQTRDEDEGESRKGALPRSEPARAI